MKKILLALFLAISAPVSAQAPPPVPALPDTERRTQYTITGTTCACAVGFQIYGDGTDFQNWIDVWLNGVNVSNTDPTFGWTLTSATGPLSSIARPITDAIVTFNSVQTGTVQIVGARRPRRTTQFSESQGVTARQFNQAFTDIVAQNRETWDKINDVTGRAILTQPGNTMKPLPVPSTCPINTVLSFGADGLTPTCIANGTSGGAKIIVAVRTATSATDAITLADYFVCAKNNSGPATENLPASPPTGLTFLIADCVGNAFVNSITIAPAAGNIDGLATFIININFQTVAVTYTGTMWKLN